MAYRTKHFDIKELVPPYVISNLSNPWIVLDDRILITADRLRERYGPILCNDWYRGGNNKLRGWRPGDTSFGAEFSQHKFGRALDLIPVNITAEKVRNDIFEDPWCTDFAYITCVEMGVSWLHLDCRNWDKLSHGILKIYP